jgi:hypothetical protein
MLNKYVGSIFHMKLTTCSPPSQEDPNTPQRKGQRSPRKRNRDESEFLPRIIFKMKVSSYQPETNKKDSFQKKKKNVILEVSGSPQ